MVNVLVIYNHNATFVKQDIKILGEEDDIDVTTLYYKNEKKYIRDAVRNNDVIVSWFASYHALRAFQLAKKYNKNSIVIVGGYDASDLPGYGMFSNPLRKAIVSNVYKNATAILPVESILRDVIVKYLPHMKEKITVVPTGYDADYWKIPHGVFKDPKLVLTVALADSYKRMTFKGIDVFEKVSRKLPKMKFIFIGATGEVCQYLTSIAKSNFVVVPPITQQELVYWYSKASIFCLLSKREGLPNTLCEAMLCECVPVTTGAGGMLSAQGQFGFYTKYGDVETTVNAISRAQSITDEGKIVRERVRTLYPLSKRKNELVSLVRELSHE